MSTTTVPFTTAGNYTYDTNKIEVTGGVAKLKLLSAGDTFTEDFANDTGHTYDNTKAEFTGGLVRHKEQLANVKFVSKFTSSINASWVTTGTTTAGTFGSPSIVSSQLQCHGAHGIYYDDVDSENVSAGAFKFIYKPNYTTGPAGNIDIFNLRASGGGNNDRLGLSHSPSGNTIRLWLYNNVGTAIYLATAIGPAFNPVSGTEYEFELNWSPSAGVVRLFINGVLHGTLSPGAWTRGTSADRVTIGAQTGGYGIANATFDEAVLFNTVQHTTGYTPGYTLNETRYLGSTVVIPEYEHTAPGSLLSMEDLTTVEAGAPRYTIQLDQSGDYLYWNGSAWAVSDGTYSQANSASVFDTNLPALNVSGDQFFQIKVHLDSTNTLASVDNLDLDFTAHTGYATDNPSIYYTAGHEAAKIETFAATEVVSGSDAIKYTISLDGTEYYYNGSAWAISSGYSQSNTAAEFLLNLATLDLDLFDQHINVYLHSDAGTTTPCIDDYTLTFDARIADPTLPEIVHIQGFIYTNYLPDSGVVVQARPYTEGHNNEGVFHNYKWTTIDTTNSNGFFHGEIMANAVGRQWEFKVGSQTYRATVPAQETVNWNTDLTLTLVSG